MKEEEINEVSIDWFNELEEKRASKAPMLAWKKREEKESIWAEKISRKMQAKAKKISASKKSCLRCAYYRKDYYKYDCFGYDVSPCHPPRNKTDEIGSGINICYDGVFKYLCKKHIK